MFACDAPQTAGAPSRAGVVGRKPPWNQPHVTPRAFMRSPTLRPLIAIVGEVVLEQSSPVGSGSLMTVPSTTVSGSSAGVAPCVWPATRFSAPGVECPNTVLK